MKKILACLFAVCMICYMLIFPERAVLAASDALGLCSRAILPTLFVFLVCSNFLINTGFGRIIKKPFSVIMQPLFGISGSGALALGLGCVSGYPVGAVCVCELYKNGDLKKNEAERLLGFCNNSGPLFIIGSVGAVMLGDKDIGYILCGVHIISSIVCGMILRVFKRESIKTSEKCESSVMSVRLIDAVTASVRSALFSVLTICAYTVLFSVIISMLFGAFDTNRITLILSGMTEMTNTIKKMCVLRQSVYGGIYSLLPAISFVLGFGGMCVHLQVINAVKKTSLNLKYYFIGKLLHGTVAAAIMFALTKIMA